MVEKIKMIKDHVLRRMESEINERGVEKVDICDLGKMADAVKDLAEAEKACWEAEYYRDVSEAMGSQGYTPESMMIRNDGMSRQGYRDSRGRYARRGYSNAGSMGYHEEIESIRETINSASPEEREKIQRELRQIVNM